MKMRFPSRMKIIFIAFGLFMTVHVMAMLPPKYLSIKDFKKCLQTQSMGTWEAWCLPKAKPSTCPYTSWKELNALQETDKIPDCSSS